MAMQDVDGAAGQREGGLGGGFDVRLVDLEYRRFRRQGHRLIGGDVLPDVIYLLAVLCGVSGLPESL